VSTEDRFTVHRDEPAEPEPAEPMNGWEWLHEHTGELLVALVVLAAIVAGAVAR